MDHPDHDFLTDFAAGLLDEPDTQGVAEHLAGCAVCRQALEAMPEPELGQRMRAAYLAGLQGEFADPPPAAMPIPPELADHFRYRILEFLGSGGMGVVFKAEHRLMNRIVALKILRRRLLVRPGAVERFRREVQAAARLSHPNIVTAYDADQVGDVSFLVMEFVEGVNLDEYVKERGPLPVDQASDLIHQAALGLAHAHEKGMVHRDIKPHNLMLTPAGVVKILDFGLARFALAAEGDEERPGQGEQSQGNLDTGSGMVLGTRDFMAPEQATDPTGADSRADLFALGRTLTYLLTGSPSGSVEQVAPALGPLVARMTAPDPGQRPRTAAEVAAALEPFMRPGGRRREWRGIVSSLVALLGLVLLASIPLVVLSSGNRPAVPFAHPKWSATSAPSQPTETMSRPAPDQVVHIVPDSGKVSEQVTILQRDDSIPLPPGGRSFRIRQDRAVEDSPTIAVAFAADGERLYSATRDGVLTRWDRADGEYRCSPPPIEAKRIGATFAGHSSPFMVIRDLQGDFAVQNAGDGNVVARRIITEARRDVGDPLAVSPDGQRVLTASDGGLCLWDRRKDNVRILRPDGFKVTRAVSFLVPADRAFFATYECIYGINLESGEKLFRWPLPAGKGVSAVSVSVDGRWIGAGLANGDIHVLEVATGEPIRRLAGGEGFPVTSLAFTPDGKRCLAYSGDIVMRLWDVEIGKILQSWQAPEPISCLAISPDGKYAAAGFESQGIWTWPLP